MKKVKSLILWMLVLLCVCSGYSVAEENGAVFTPSYGSPYADTGSRGDYWTLPMDITDEEAVWDMLISPVTVVDNGKKNAETEQIYLYGEPDENSMPVGVVTCLSQAVRVIENAGNGWTLVECYSSSFAGTSVPAWNVLVQGYVRTSWLKTVKPDQTWGIVIDKLTQRLYIFMEGKLYSTLVVSTGKVVWNGEKYQPYNETRSGEFLLKSKVGGFKSDNMFCDKAIRFNKGDLLHEVPSVTYRDGSKDYSTCEAKLGTKASHGCIRVQRKRTPEGVNMSWIWNKVSGNKSNVKLVIWEDWQGRQIAYPSDDLTLYYNPKGGSYYHSEETCYSATNITLTPFNYGELENAPFNKLKYCPFCAPAMRKAAIDEINEQYLPGGDHNPLLTELRQEYFDRTAQ